jgi:hypothetical protein
MSIILDGTNGETFPSWTTSTRPASPTAGQVGYNSTYGGLEVYNGSAWDTITGGPAFSAYYTGTGQTINSGTDTLITINTKEFDTIGAFNNTGSTTTLNGLSVPAYAFMPPIAGYYQITIEAQLNTGSNTVSADIFKDGNYFKRGTLGAAQNPFTSALVYLNGSTDYVQFYVYSSGSTTTQSTNVAQTYFQAAFIRGA